LPNETHLRSFGKELCNSLLPEGWRREGNYGRWHSLIVSWRQPHLPLKLFLNPFSLEFFDVSFRDAMRGYGMCLAAPKPLPSPLVCKALLLSVFQARGWHSAW